MATSFKSFLNNDVTTTRTLLHEAIPITGSILSGTYNNPAVVYTGSNAAFNIKNYSHGLFQSVYDYPFLSSSANHIFDLTVGYSNQSALSASANSQNADKINIYNQMAQLLVGHDQTGSIREFDADGNLSDLKIRDVRDTYTLSGDVSLLFKKDTLQTILTGSGSVHTLIGGLHTAMEFNDNFEVHSGDNHYLSFNKFFEKSSMVFSNGEKMLHGLEYLETADNKRLRSGIFQTRGDSFGAINEFFDTNILGNNMLLQDGSNVLTQGSDNLALE